MTMVMRPEYNPDLRGLECALTDYPPLRERQNRELVENVPP
jgi:hypothetical protein